MNTTARPLRALLRVAALTSVVACTHAPTPPACLAAEARAVEAGAGHAPLAWITSLLADHDVVVLGEYHGLPAQIRLAGAALEAASKAGLAVDLAVEVLPLGRQETLDRLVAEGLDPAGWAEVVGGKYYPPPLTIAEYGDLVAATARSPGARLFGLAPGCSPDEQGSRDRAIGCLDERDMRMFETVEARLAGGRKLIILAGFAHADLARPESLASLLGAAHPGRVASLLLDGPVVEPETEGGPWARPCGGLFQLLDDYEAGDGLAVDLGAAPFDAPDHRCLGGALDQPARYDGVISQAAGPNPTALAPEVYAALSDEDLARWNRFNVELLGAPSAQRTRPREDWAADAAADAARYAAVRISAPDWCAAR